VPDDWHPKAKANVARIQKRLKDVKVDVALNTDQNVVKFYMEEETVIAPTGMTRVGNRVNANTEKGFILMVACNLNTSKIKAPFPVFNGTKLCRAKYPGRTLAYKHRNWHNSAPGKTGFMNSSQSNDSTRIGASSCWSGCSMCFIPDVRWEFCWTWPLFTGVGG
jgi:hypothetical protein